MYFPMTPVAPNNKIFLGMRASVAIVLHRRYVCKEVQGSARKCKEVQGSERCKLWPLWIESGATATYRAHSIPVVEKRGCIASSQTSN
jgi:hypothetical protein